MDRPPGQTGDWGLAATWPLDAARPHGGGSAGAQLAGPSATGAPPTSPACALGAAAALRAARPQLLPPRHPWQRWPRPWHRAHCCPSAGWRRCLRCTAGQCTTPRLRRPCLRRHSSGTTQTRSAPFPCTPRGRCWTALGDLLRRTDVTPEAADLARATITQRGQDRQRGWRWCQVGAYIFRSIHARHAPRCRSRCAARPFSWKRSALVAPAPLPAPRRWRRKWWRCWRWRRRKGADAGRRTSAGLHRTAGRPSECTHKRRRARQVSGSDRGHQRCCLGTLSQVLCRRRAPPLTAARTGCKDRRQWRDHWPAQTGG